MPLNWSEATHADRAQLQTFVCAYPERYAVDRVTWQKTHPQPWQIRVQSGLRGLKPPLSRPQRLLLGKDDRGIAGVGMFEDDVELDAFYIRAIARAQRLRGKRIADEVLERVLEEIRSDQRHVVDGIRDVYCEAHWKNHASKAMLKRHGFECSGDEGGLETWSLDLGEPPLIIDVIEIVDEATERAG